MALKSKNTMFNSYATTCGTTQPICEDVNDTLVEILCDVLCDTELCETDALNDATADTLREALLEADIVIDENICAHLLDSAFHFANENFYEQFPNNDREMQDDYLENITLILQTLLKSRS